MKHYDHHLPLSLPANLRQLSLQIDIDQHPTTVFHAIIDSQFMSTIFSHSHFWPSFDDQFLTILSNQTMSKRFREIVVRKLSTIIDCNQQTFGHYFSGYYFSLITDDQLSSIFLQKLLSVNLWQFLSVNHRRPTSKKCLLMSTTC